MKNIDLSLYLVTNRDTLSMDAFLQILADAIDGGVKIVQLREKNASFKEFCDIGLKVKSLLEPKNIPLIINDNIEVASAIKADGVHLGRDDRKVHEARKILGKNAIIGLSVETIKQVVEASQCDIDYLAVSPVFPSLTKPDCFNPWGLNGLSYVCSISRHPVVAVGGINEQNITDVMKCGPSGVAVISAIFNATSPNKVAKALYSKIKQIS